MRLEIEVYDIRRRLEDVRRFLGRSLTREDLKNVLKAYVKEARDRGPSKPFSPDLEGLIDIDLEEAEKVE